MRRSFFYYCSIRRRRWTFNRLCELYEHLKVLGNEKSLAHPNRPLHRQCWGKMRFLPIQFCISWIRHTCVDQHQRSVSLTMRCRVAVVGRNDSGKSTFVPLLTGALAPTRGEAWPQLTCGPLLTTRPWGTRGVAQRSDAHQTHGRLLSPQERTRVSPSFGHLRDRGTTCCPRHKDTLRRTESQIGPRQYGDGSSTPAGVGWADQPPRNLLHRCTSRRTQLILR